MNIIRSYFLYSVCILTLFFVGVHRADAQDAQVKVLSSVEHTGEQTAVLMGLQFSLPDGAYIYAPDVNDTTLRHPNVILDHKSFENIKEFTIEWPTGTQQHQPYTHTTYENGVIIPFIVRIHDPHKPVHFKGVVEFVACQKYCVPYEIPVDFTLSPGPATPTAHANNIMAYMHDDPLKELLEIEEISLIWVIITAFLGGLILNFMPCVLPVLSLKLRTLVKQSHVSANVSYKAHFMATFLGIMVSFLCYAALAIAMQWAGSSLGWGMHFQEPLFLIGMCVLMVLFAANLWGAFDIHLPGALQNKMHRTLTQQQAKLRLYTEGFLSGVFATLLATPCTAPFLGTTLGYALSHSPIYILILFMVLGFGFATPYWLALLIPQRFMWLPKPGLWLTRLSRILGGGLLLTTVWLLWLLYQTKGLYITALVATLLTMLLAVLFLRSKKRFFHYMIVPLCVSIFAIPVILEEQADLEQAEKESLWHAFEPEKIPDLINKGHIVYVDITAAWCVTCHINKHTILEKPSFLALLEQGHIYGMRADWTKPNQGIKEYLARHGRHGIPFNQIISKENPKGTVLPELLTFENVWQNLKNNGLKE